MNLACETEIGVQNELALRFTIISKPTPLLEYIKTISSLVGASHVLAVFEENDTLKVFFDDKSIIDILIRTGIHVMGRHVRVDYVVPPGPKVVLSSIDPVVSNFYLMRLLSMYGTIVSPIICPPISDEMEFCHIGYGVRYCYMTINEPIPEKLEFKYGNQMCEVKIRVADEVILTPIIKSDEYDLSETNLADTSSAPEPSINVDKENAIPSPVVVSVESVVSESNTDVHLGVANISESNTDVHFGVTNVSESSTDVHLGVAKLPIKRKQLGNNRSQQTLKIKRTKVTSATRAAKKIQHNVKHSWVGKKKVKTFRKGKRGRRPLRLLKKSLSPPPRLPSLSPSTSDVDDDLPPPLLSTEKKDISIGPLREEKFLEFINECKHHRAPIELAKKYLGSDSDNVIHKLTDQIESHAKNATCHSLKSRLTRLSKLLLESVNASKS